MNNQFQADRVAARGHPAIGAARAEFLARTYSHLFASIAIFTLIEIALFRSGLAERIAVSMLGVSWLLVLGGFVVVSWVASRVAARAESMPAQYGALGGFILAEALIFVPLLFLANLYAPGVISSAALVTLLAFAGLTAVVFVTRKDFSFLRGVVGYGMVVAVVAIVAATIFGWELGTWFSVGMIALAGAAILWDTSRILHHYPEDRHVSAALELFASVALMFWYVLRLFMSRD
ncbi:MAG: Bax inhibitor-1 family protein [Gemmatimonadetes bacterium]|nr:Bax inhibitor-1 family protein [Gemmatimonadota bacterium]